MNGQKRVITVQQDEFQKALQKIRLQNVSSYEPSIKNRRSNVHKSFLPIINIIFLEKSPLFFVNLRYFLPRFLKNSNAAIPLIAVAATPITTYVIGKLSPNGVKITSGTTSTA